MDTTKLVVERLRVLVGIVGRDVEHTVRHGPHGRELIRVARQDAAGAGWIARRIQRGDRLRGREIGDAVRVVVGEPVHGRADINASGLAQLVVQPRPAAPARREQPLVGVLNLVRVGLPRHSVRERLARLGHGVLRREQFPVPEIHRHGELAAEHLREGHGVIVRQPGHALVEGTVGQARGDPEHAPLGIEPGLRYHVDRAADRIAIHVRRRRFHDLHAFHGVGAHRLKLILARGAGGRRVGEPIPIHRDCREILVEPADAHVADRAVDRVALDARQPDQQVRRILGQVAEGVGGDHVLHPIRQPLERDRLRVALALTGDDKLIHGVDLRREPDLALGRLARRDRHRHVGRIKTRVRDDQRHRSRRQIIEAERPLPVRHRLPGRPLQGDARALERAAGGFVDHVAGQGLLGGSRSSQGGQSEQNEDERSEGRHNGRAGVCADPAAVPSKGDGDRKSAGVTTSRCNAPTRPGQSQRRLRSDPAPGRIIAHGRSPGSAITGRAHAFDRPCSVRVKKPVPLRRKTC